MKKNILAVVLAAASVATLQAQTTIINYSTGGTNVPGYTGYFNTTDGWTGGAAFWQGQEGWTGNNSQADSVEVVAGYTPGGGGDNSGTLGLYAPLFTTSTLARAFTPMSTAVFTNISTSFVAEWSISQITAPNAFDDLFTFDLAQGVVSGLLFGMQAPGSFGFDYNLSVVDAGGSTAEFGMNYDSVYRMQIDITGTTWSGTLYGVTDPSGTRTINSLGSFTGGTLANGLTATDLNTTYVEWVLDSGNVADPGSIALIANEFTFSSTGDPIPEPGTWAMGAILLTGAAAAAYRRRKAQTEKASA